MTKVVDKKKIVKDLDKLTTRVAKRIKRNKNKDFLLIQKKEEKVVISDFIITKDMDGMYVVSNKGGKVVFKEVSSFEVASSLVHSMVNKNIHNISVILDLNRTYNRLYNEMTFFEHSLKTKKDDDRFIVLSRLDTTLIRMEAVLDELYRFKISI